MINVSVFSTSITLTVSPSGPVEVNQTVTLQCIFENFPISAAFYSTASIDPFCDLSSVPSGTNCKPTACSTNYIATCPNDRTYSVVYPVPQRWNGKGVYCKGILTGDERSNQVNFSVIVLVKSVTLHPTQITMDVGKQITLTCQTNYCNPAANITWYKASPILATPTTDTTDIDSNGLVRTTSVLQYTGVAGDNGQQVYCRASNRPGQRVESNKYMLDIRYPPFTDPVITASPPGLQYNTGTRVTLTCHLSGGNPLATLLWRCKNTVMSGTNQSTFTTAVSVLSLVIDSSFNNQHCACTANHSLLTSPKSTSVSLTVFYPPSTDPVITASPPGLQYNTGSRVTLTCQLSGGNPLATLSWRCKNIAMTGTNQSTSTTAVSVFSLVMDSSYNNQQCTCTANHSLLTSPKSRNVSLTVFYPPSSDPVITASPPGLLYNTGTKVTLTCQLSGGNPLAMLSWRCKNTAMTGTSQSNSTTAVSVLSLVMDSSYNNQQCTCTANHNLFTSPKSTSVSLNVFYNNIITSNWNQTYSIKEHENFHLDCEVDGNPLSNITWMLVKSSTVLKKNYRVKKSSLEITSAACLDYGTYKVLADNGKGPRASKTAKLIVKCKPRLYMTDSITPVRIGVGNNDPLQIFVRILLFPPAIQTTWYFSGKTNENKIIRNSIDGYRIKHRNGDVEQNITLYKESVNIEDFGHYTLRVENEIGVFTMIFYAISTKKMDV
ncbi:synaptogenesis protein syg-2-like [Saccostrea echinata]|uniref:synaptogenesis protein syg-2-like n=1 Tax=Saccostrea echinata TaxID=191078 RepID=UPI002A7FB68C|nr:synaptogenesis protein syg-2-like [Saccostrea echinata]